MSTIQFCHANGFGAKTYSHFFSFLEPYTISAVELIGHGKHPVAPSWKPLAQELIEHIETHQTKPVIGMGHSLGGVILLYAAQERPELFQQVIFLDPPMFHPFKTTILKILKWTGQYDKFAPSGRSKVRRQYFETQEAALQYFSKKKLFENFDEQCLKDYAYLGLKPNDEHGFELAFRREIEYQVFREFPAFWRKIPLSVPSDFIYSNHFKVLQKSDIQWLKRLLPNTEFMGFEGGHLFPQEQPKEVAALVKRLIKLR